MDLLEEIVARSKEARDGCWEGLSTSEQLVTALVLNRADWIKKMGYTLAGAIHRVGPSWMEVVPEAERILREEA